MKLSRNVAILWTAIVSLQVWAQDGCDEVRIPVAWDLDEGTEQDLLLFGTRSGEEALAAYEERARYLTATLDFAHRAAAGGPLELQQLGRRIFDELAPPDGSDPVVLWPIAFLAHLNHCPTNTQMVATVEHHWLITPTLFTPGFGHWTTTSYDCVPIMT